MLGLPSVEIPAASFCNLNCTYCYIPKCDSLHKIHKKWKKKYDSGEFIDIIEGIMGNKLENLSLWGTEPSIGIMDVLQHLKRLMNVFPRLRSISTSSNMILIDNIIKGIKTVMDHGLKFDLQISLDGPKDITDKNRGEGVTDKVVNNIMKLGEFVESKGLNIDQLVCSFKSTSTMDDYREYASNPKAIKKYILFFDNLLHDIFSRYPSMHRVLMCGSVMPTCVMPGKYTVDDGRIYAQYSRNLNNVIDDVDLKVIERDDLRSDQVYVRVSETIRSIPYLFKDYRMFHTTSCAGGRSMLGIDMEGISHICHRSYWLEDDEFRKHAIEYTEKNYDESCTVTNEQNTKNIRVNYTAREDPDNDNYNLKRLGCILHGYHASYQMRFNTTCALIASMRDASQVLDIYTIDNIHTKLLAHVISTKYECPADNIMYTGSSYTQSVSVIKLLGNGAVLQATKDVINGKYRRRI